MKRDRGYMYERTKWNDLEKAFADHWEQENEPKGYVCHGCGLLQNLFFKGDWPFESCVHAVTPGERYVAATAVQWLGTNCGFAFLQEVLRSQGLYITEIPQHEPLEIKKINPEMRFARKITV